MQENVCAVVVTYNRLDYLKRLISCLENQTFPVTEIIIVDNGSTDGTKEWLNSQKYIVIHQGNVGSAGGFHTGIGKALQGSCDYIWIMDDDGYPTPTCLEKLYTSKAKETFNDKVVLCSMVVNEENPGELSFPVPDFNSKYYKVFDYYKRLTDKVSDIKSYKDPHGYPWGPFFNSILLPVSVVRKVGLPKKELFIWGDEVEYLNRIMHSGYKVYMIPDSVFFHPKLKFAKLAKWKEKYHARNYVFIHKKYKPLPFIHHLKTILRILLSRKFYLLRPFYHGLTNNFKSKYH